MVYPVQPLFAALKAGESVDLLKMFLGQTGGTIGETSVIAILIGAAYLVFRKVISLRISISLYYNTGYLCTFIWRPGL